MNQKIKAVQTALEKVDQITMRRRELEAEQKALQSKIQKLTASVADGDAKSVNDLQIASARSAYGIPRDLDVLKSEFDAAIRELRQTLIPLSPMVAKAYGAERQRMEDVVTEFLEEHISKSGHESFGHEIQEICTRIVQISKTVHPLDFLNTRFSGAINIQHLGAESAISRGRDAIKSLSHIE